MTVGFKQKGLSIQYKDSDIIAQTAGDIKSVLLWVLVLIVVVAMAGFSYVKTNYGNSVKLVTYHILDIDYDGTTATYSLKDSAGNEAVYKSEFKPSNSAGDSIGVYTDTEGNLMVSVADAMYMGSYVPVFSALVLVVFTVIVSQSVVTAYYLDLRLKVRRRIHENRVEVAVNDR